MSNLSIEDADSNTAKTLEVMACPRISLNRSSNTEEYDQQKKLAEALQVNFINEDGSYGVAITSESNIVFRPTNGSAASNSYISVGGSQNQNSQKKFDDVGQNRDAMSPEIIIEAVSDRDVYTGELKSEMTDGDRDGFIYH